MLQSCHKQKKKLIFLSLIKELRLEWLFLILKILALNKPDKDL